MRLCNYSLINAIVFLIKMLVECKYTVVNFQEPLGLFSIAHLTVGDLSRSGNQGIPHFTFPIGKKMFKSFPFGK